ncbi:hypothetical protein E4L96_06375 [Massilia arenosa]|uniref:PET hydrolase/cutinase-like domain-containing protein n=1 Tax=Zemynaea arenosa TaxID=2561931 RepID=A0A4Y9SHF0_9BURK|nr:alpha/beta hydrolase [Massilia arenosa]TFW24042.1 hypothetical protein E4L96_06375 [Massilia arenosa]
MHTFVFPAMFVLACAALPLPASAALAATAGAALGAPPLSGPYAVGRAQWQWTDRGAHHALVLYPAAGTSSTLTNPSGTTPPAQLTARYGAAGVAQLAALQVRSVPGLAPASVAGPRPVLVFASGAHQKAGDYTVLLEQIASRGYVVVALDAPAAGEPYASTADEIASALREVDRQRANGPWADRLDEPAGAFGHSIGGAGAVLALARNPRLRAAFNLDGDFTGAAESARPVKPVAVLQTEAPPRSWLGALAERRSEQRRADIWKQVRSAARETILLSARGLRHANFLDAALIAPSAMDAKQRAERFGTMDGTRGLLMTADVVTSWFDAALGKGQPVAALRASAARYPELSLQ